MRIGLDFDNTIAAYDQAFLSLACDWGLREAAGAANRLALRDALRAREGGELDWQRLQGRVYGAELARAILFDGVAEFLTTARTRGHDIVIVSHKSQYGHYDPDHVDLRMAALQWMTDQGFFDRFDLARDAVFFEPTRADKIARIRNLAPDWFIDDLPEVLEDASFPRRVRPVWFTGGTVRADGRGVASWGEIARLVLT